MVSFPHVFGGNPTEHPLGVVGNVVRFPIEAFSEGPKDSFGELLRGGNDTIRGIIFPFFHFSNIPSFQESTPPRIHSSNPPFLHSSSPPPSPPLPIKLCDNHSRDKRNRRVINPEQKYQEERIRSVQRAVGL